MSGYRKTPILLRRGPLSGEVVVIHGYSLKMHPKGEVAVAHTDGKQSVQADYDNLVLEQLLADGAENIVGILDAVADGWVLTRSQRAQVRCLRERLRTIAERHNARVDS